ncbi:MAG: hypothetical protein CO135_03025 [Candidatus Levybacteria bacterium CG_4_9_14_3_um_filter_35_16]|nr:MAG: hypothetical protein COW87_03340 [Candidatus Levybacteria bacterium CG22_combo_CG10-13_8_21_14_all_35_11]PIY94597.1 MAG: hypothetical protein COY68_01825 [Candidatus Levybacteria bacterium CG_4_10_14_0_8_um_filter_35_23]PIZ97920.1 MAG: hypothetical protein COX78_04110 [Candidatus Levybacteria bacterium CG_4_10_14_0_2_um_filter_35_8]PJA91046.1 MAG: hypothetical protein CO135_03025 [Candidatus Levybacteria bacterium CG_4_9_14_3_um_filter_35_16]PJC54101.1 MAG: hypothetical protein CO028_04
MKKIFIIILLLLIISGTKVSSSFALNPTATPEPSPETAQLDDLKTRIASRVAQLNLVEKRAIAGTVKETSGTQIVLEDIKKEKRYVDVDELTKFSSPSSKSFGLSDISKDTVISVIGLYNKQSRRIMAREIETTTLPVFFQGAVVAIDPKNHTFKLAGESERITVDVETITKTFQYTADNGIKTSGFSKIINNENTIVFGYWDKRVKDQLLATRIIIFPILPKNPKIIFAPNVLDNSETIIPSTGSGKKLTPIVR